MRGMISRSLPSRVAPVLAVGVAAAFAVAQAPTASVAAPHRSVLSGTPIGTYAGGSFDESAAEIVAYAPAFERAFVVNAEDGTTDVLDLSDPSEPTLVGQLATPGVNSVDVRGRIVAVAQAAEDKTAPGTVAFFHARSLRQRGEVTVGALPDALTFTPDGRRVVVANEGEPEGYCNGQTDPVGSVSIIDLARGPARATVRTAGFAAFDGQEDALRAQGVRIYGPGASVSEDLEPEFVAISGRRAFVTLQENNALAVVDLVTAQVQAIRPLGLKDHEMEGAGLDPSDRDGGPAIGTWPVLGMYQPDGIASFRGKKGNFLITANEGDAREYDCLLDDSRAEQAEDERVKNLELDPTAFPDAAALQKDTALGRLGVSLFSPQDSEGEYTELHALGARSATIWSPGGDLVWDSGDLFERVTADLPSYNANNDETDSADSRSDNKGPEPEGVVVGRVGGRMFAFVGLERTSAIVILDVTQPAQPRFQSLLTNRDEAGDAEEGTAGDLGPEGLEFVSATDSPNGKPLLLVGNEVSGTTTVWQLGDR